MTSPRAARVGCCPEWPCFSCSSPRPSAFTAVDESALDWLASLTFTKNFHQYTWLTAHLWSLSVEAQFYAPWGPAFALLGARAPHALAVFALASVFRAVCLATSHPYLAHASLPANADLLMAGAIVALVQADGRRALPNGSGVLALAAGAAVAAALVEPSLPLLARALAPAVQAAAIGLIIAVLVTREGGARSPS